jgi:UDP-glucose 4-epimerase
VIALVTGGAGFIGSHLAERLLGAGHEVVVLDDLSTGDLRNLAAVEGSPRLHARIGSVTDESLVGELVERADCVFHLAAAVGVKLIVEHPTRTIETNVRGTEVVLRAAAARGRPVLLASSSEVYGKSLRVPFAEDDDIVLGATSKSRWGYACSKAIDEYLALAHARESGLPVVIARFFNTVGPRQTGRYGMVLPTFVRQGLAGDDITVYGDGEQRRCFADVSEVVDCALALAACEAARGRVFNVGSDREVSINALAELVRERTGGASRIVHVPYEDAYTAGFEDLGRRVPDCSRLEGAIGRRPVRPLEAIVEAVIASMKRLGAR